MVRGIWDVGYKVLNVEYGMGKERCKAWDVECRMRGTGHGVCDTECRPWDMENAMRPPQTRLRTHMLSSLAPNCTLHSKP